MHSLQRLKQRLMEIYGGLKLLNGKTRCHRCSQSRIACEDTKAIRISQPGQYAFAKQRVVSFCRRSLFYLNRNRIHPQLLFFGC